MATYQVIVSENTGRYLLRQLDWRDFWVTIRILTDEQGEAYKAKYGLYAPFTAEEI